MVKYYWLKARDNNIPIGSGLISRRIKPYRTRKRRNPHNEKNNKPTGDFKFPSQQIKIIFNYWNGFGPPFTTHVARQSKVTSRGFSAIKVALKKYETRQITEAMDLLHVWFKADWFRYKRYYTNSRLSLPDFFKYELNTFKQTLNSKGIPRSWFEEVLRGQKYFKRIYSYYAPDKNPEVTKILYKAWKDYSHKRPSQNDKNVLVSCSKQLVEFCGDGELTASALARWLRRWLISTDHSLRPNHINYFTSRKFFETDLPMYINRANLND